MMLAGFCLMFFFGSCIEEASDSVLEDGLLMDFFMGISLQRWLPT